MRRLERLFGRFAITLVVVAVAVVVAWQLWGYYMEAPWTRDGRVSADVVGVAPDVSGLVVQILVHDNQAVKRDQVLFQIDPVRFQLAIDQAEAVLAARQATAQEAVREMKRVRALTNLEVSTEEQEQYTAKAAEAGAAYDQAVANRNVARLNLERATVRASVNGIVTNFGLRPGDYVTAGKAVFALVDTDSLRVDGYFEETKLPRIRVGDRARAHLMGESAVIDGHVQSISGGIANRDVSGNTSLLADVNPTFAWVRLAQRVPVRIAIDHVPDGVHLLPGRTATVEVLEGGR
jgi:RND family efflux transporter MFP subunit